MLHVTPNNSIGIDEYLDRNRHKMSPSKYRQRTLGLQAARKLTKMTILNETPRVFGMYDDRVMVFPYYKLRTMPIMTEEQKADMHRLHKDVSYNKHNSDAGRTRIGRILAKKSLDEILMINWVIGSTKLFGKVRPPLVGEIEADTFTTAAQEFNLQPIEALEKLTDNAGELTVAGYLGSRIQDRFGRWLWMLALVSEKQPTKAQVIQGHLDSSFRHQTGGDSELAVRSNQHAQLVYTEYLPEIATTPEIKLEPLPIIVD